MKKLIIITVLFSLASITKTIGQTTSMLDLSGLKDNGVTPLKFGSGINLFATTKNKMITKFTATDSLGKVLPVEVKATPKPGGGGGGTITCEVCVNSTKNGVTTRKCQEFDCTKDITVKGTTKTHQ